MKYYYSFLNPVLIIFFFTGCSIKQPEPKEIGNLLDWTLQRPVVITENPGVWQWFRSENFPLTDSEISYSMDRGFETVQIHDLNRMDQSAPVTWFIHASDSVPDMLSNYSFNGDTLLFDDYKLDLSGKYFFTVFTNDNTSSFYEIIFAGKNANSQVLEDFINRTLFITDQWFLYNRNELMVTPIQTSFQLKESYPHFPDGSLYAEWIEKIRISSLPAVVGEAFEAFINMKPLPVVTGDICTFFWFEEPGDYPVYILSDRTGWTANDHNQMMRIPGTHIHFLQTDLHAESRIEYLIRWNDCLYRDYLNPKYTGKGYFSHSLCMMPEYESVPEVEKVPLYYQSEYDKFVTRKGNDAVLILPPGYSFSSSRYRTLYLVNSASHESVIRTIMDNLMLSGQIPPVITVLSDGDDLYELIRDVDTRYRTQPDPSYRFLAAWSSHTKFIPFDSKISQNYILISPMELDESFNAINEKMSVNLSWGLYDLPQVHDLIKKRTDTMKTGILNKHTFPGGHHSIEWYGELVYLLKEIVGKD